MSKPTPTPNASFDEPSGLLPTDVPATAARWTGWLLILITVAAAIFCVTFKLPQTVIAPFEIVPVEGAATVQSPVAGQLAAVRVQAGQTVKAGDELFQVRSDSVRDADSRLMQLGEDQRALIEQAAKRDAAHLAELSGNDAAIALARRELSFRGEHHTATRAILERKEKAVADGLLPRLTLLSDRLVMAESESARVLAEQHVQELVLQRAERVDLRARQRRDEAASGEKLRVQSETLRAQLANSDGDLQSIRAPFDAVVLSIAAQTPGSVIAIGVELGQLARQGAAAQARLRLPERDVPKLRLGQRVRLFVEAYPYQRFGSFDSELAWISPTPVSAQSESQFLAFGTLPAEVKTNMPLRIGMSGEARILVGRRTLLEIALEPMRALRERAFIE